MFRSLFQRLALALACVLLVTMSLPLTMVPQAAFAQSSTVSINPTQGPPSTQVTGTGANWTAGDQMQVSWDDGTVLANTTVQSNGTFTVGFKIPTNATLGGHTIYFTDLDSRYFLTPVFKVTGNGIITGKWISPHNAFITQNGRHIQMRASADSSIPNDSVVSVDFVAWWPGQPGDDQHPSTVICANTPVVSGTTDQHICDWAIGNMPIGILWLGFKVHDQAGNTIPYPGGLLWGTITAQQNVNSGNYGGYGVSGTSSEVFQYFDVKGTWVVNSIPCGLYTAHAGFWVGLAGPKIPFPTIEQIGTASFCDKLTTTYYAWYEMYPGSVQRLDKINSSFVVKAGDTITAEVKYQGNGSFLFSLKDSRWTKSFSKAVQGSSDPSVRENALWIVEDVGGTKLPDFGTVPFTNCTIDSDPITQGPLITKFSIAATGDSSPRAYPKSLTSGGKSFSVVWQHFN